MNDYSIPGREAAREIIRNYSNADEQASRKLFAEVTGDQDRAQRLNRKALFYYRDEILWLAREMAGGPVFRSVSSREEEVYQKMIDDQCK